MPESKSWIIRIKVDSSDVEAHMNFRVKAESWQDARDIIDSWFDSCNTRPYDFEIEIIRDTGIQRLRT